MVDKITTDNFRPERFKLGGLAAARLGTLTGIESTKLIGLTATEIGERYRRIDPQLLLFRSVCGKVVKKDPVSGVEHPVPHATVLAEDSECSLLGYFPASSKWAWYFPFNCQRETITTVKTNECGNFSVWIPRWDIDWVLRFHRERQRYPMTFERPSLRDMLDDLIPKKIPGPGPGSGPDRDSMPFTGINRGRFIKLVEDALSRGNALSLNRMQSQPAIDANPIALEEAFADVALIDGLIDVVMPPLPEELCLINTRTYSELLGEQRNAVAAMLGLDSMELGKLDLRAHIGPFKRGSAALASLCMPIRNVPDITFRVTQDIGAGIEEEIYSEGLFQVRWNAVNLPTLKLVAKPNARANYREQPAPRSNTPAIMFAGCMPVINEPTIYDSTTGYALRPNRPHLSGLFGDALPKPAAATPFHGAIALLGRKNHLDAAATHYRLIYKYSNDNGATFTDFMPFVELTWPLFRINAGVPQWHYPKADADGWYPLTLPAGSTWLPSENMLMDWPTREFADGRYVLKLELGTPAGKTSSSAEVAFNIDNSLPLGPLTVEWRKAGSGAFQLLNSPCACVHRGDIPADLEFRVTMVASATHLRSAILTAVDCGGGNLTWVSGTTEHWHVSTSDNTEILQAIYRLPKEALQGTYGFGGEVSGRAFNPSGSGHLKQATWEYDPNDSHIYPSFAFSVIDADLGLERMLANGANRHAYDALDGAREPAFF